jgi:hypothetical protein
MSSLPIAQDRALKSKLTLEEVVERVAILASQRVINLLVWRIRSVPICSVDG